MRARAPRDSGSFIALPLHADYETLQSGRLAGNPPSSTDVKSWLMSFDIDRSGASWLQSHACSDTLSGINIGGVETCSISRTCGPRRRGQSANCPRRSGATGGLGFARCRCHGYGGGVRPTGPDLTSTAASAAVYPRTCPAVPRFAMRRLRGESSTKAARMTNVTVVGRGCGRRAHHQRGLEHDLAVRRTGDRRGPRSTCPPARAGNSR